MKIIWLWGVIALVFTVGAFRFVWQGGLPKDPAPVRVMNPTQFKNNLQVGAVVYRRFWQEFHSEKVVIAGSSPLLRGYDEVWLGLLSLVGEKQQKFDVVFEQSGLRSLSEHVQSLDWSKVNEAIAQNKKILIHLVATDAMWSEARAQVPRGLFLIQNVLPLSDNDDVIVGKNCENSSAELLATQKLSCLAAGVQRRSKRRQRNLNPKETWGVIEQVGAREHVIYVHEKTHEKK